MNTTTDQTVAALAERRERVAARRRQVHRNLAGWIEKDLVLDTGLLEDAARCDARAVVWARVGQIMEHTETADVVAEVRGAAISQLAAFSEPSSTSPLQNLARAATAEAWGDVLRTVGY